MKLAVSQIEYTKYDDKPIIHLFGRDSEQIRHHVRVYGIFPFFYIDRNTPVPKNDRIVKIANVSDNGWTSIKGNEVKKIIMKLPEDVGGNRKEKQGFRTRFKHTYEDDIEFTTRAAIELNLKSGIEVKKFDNDLGIDPIKSCEFKIDPRRMHVDIETSTQETGGRIPNWKNPVNQIYCLSFYDSYTEVFYVLAQHPKYADKTFETHYKTPFDVNKYKKFKTSYRVVMSTFSNERKMLSKFIDYVNEINPDMITGWNSRKFDIPYIIERSKILKLDVAKLSPLRSVYIDAGDFAHIKGRICFDTMEAYKKTLLHEIESLKLDNVAKKLFEVGKIKHKGVDYLYEYNRNLLLKYNLQDVFLDFAIGLSQGAFQFLYDVKCYSGCTFEDVLNNSRIIDAYMLFKAHEQKIVLPSKRNREEDTYEGAIVFQAPRKGIAEWLGVLDLKSLYPMCMLSLNMGEDTIVLNPPAERIPSLIKSPIKGVYFRKDKPSFLAGILKELLDYRDSLKKFVKTLKKEGKFEEAEIQDRIQTVVKFITNTIYGVMGYAKFRLYNKKIAACITAVARLVITFTKKMLIKWSYEMYYGDTDSVFPLLKHQNVAEGSKELIELVDKLNKSYDIFKKIFNIDTQYFQEKAEKIYKTFFMVLKKGEKKVAKKRYAGIITWEGEECDKLEIKGFDRSDMSRVGNIITKKVLEMACYGKPLNEISEYLKCEVAKIRNRQYPLSEIAFSKGISKALNTYGNQDWIRAARWTNLHSSLWNAQTNYGARSKPKFVYLIESKIPAQYEKIELVALDENYFLPDHLAEAIDYETLVDKTIRLKVESTLDALGLIWDSIISKAHAKSLLSYTSSGDKK